MPPDVVPPLVGVFPTTIVGWLTAIGVTATTTLLLWDRITGRGKSLATIDGKLDRMCEQYAEHEETLKVIDSHLDTLSTDVRALKTAWKGEDGNNGAKSKIADHDKRITDIEKRNYFIDETAKRERENYTGPERRRELRRTEDVNREIRSIPEPRDDKP